MIESSETEIDGFTYTFRPLMATPARKLLDELIQRFGGPLGQAIEALDRADGLTLDDDTSNPAKMIGHMAAPLGSIVAGLSAQLDPGFHAKLVDTLGKCTTYREGAGKEMPLSADNREMHFATSLLSETKWIGFCLQCQYADFLGLFRGTMVQAVALKAMANTSPRSGSQTGSTGGSSASQQASGTAPV